MRVTWQVIKMKTGGLLVYAPVAPTDECIALLNDLDAPVEYILLPTTLFEHKLFMGPFQVRRPLPLFLGAAAKTEPGKGERESE
jgi:hypothetical protein